MASNIEIKARARDFARQLKLAAALADIGPEDLRQEDTFFNVATARLKLREFGDGTGELIHYDRPNTPEPSESRYILHHTTEPATLKAALIEALGVRAVVRKRRRVWLAGRTRIHLDEVDRLGKFLELEVVMADGDAREAGVAEADDLMGKLEIKREDLVDGAYVDLLETRAD